MEKIKTLTAIGENDLNNKLKESPKYEIVTGDILYKEGILEFLETKSNLDLIILKENLPGEISIEELKTKVRKINKEIKIEIIKDQNEYLLKIKPDIEIEVPKEDINKIINKPKTIGIVGSSGIGKSSIARVIEESNKEKKVKIIDIEEEKEKEKEKIEEQILKEKVGIDIIIIDGLERIKNISNFNFKLLDEILIVSGANLIEIKKSIKAYTKINFMKRKNKIKVLFNKVSRASIEDSLLRGVFKNVKVVGKIKYNDLFDYAANTDDYEELLKEDDVKEFIKNFKI